MVRVEALGPSVTDYCLRTGDGSSTHDVCRACYEELCDDPHAFDNVLYLYNGEPANEDGWGGDVEHPPYDDSEMYFCMVCDATLTDDIDGIAD